MDEIDLRLSNVALSGGDNGGKLPEFDGVAGDVVIQSGKDSLKAHKIVLKSCPYFSAVIEGNWLESQHLEPTIALKGCVYLIMTFSQQSGSSVLTTWATGCMRNVLTNLPAVGIDHCLCHL